MPRFHCQLALGAILIGLVMPCGAGADPTTTTTATSSTTTSTSPPTTTFDGKANRFTQGGGDTAQIRISGRFCLAATVGLDLSTATVRLDQLLDEVGGAGELLNIVPLTLSAVPSRSTPSSARYECLAPACDRAATPSLKMTAKTSGGCTLPDGSGGTSFQFLLDINRGDNELRIPPRYSASPAACSGDPLATSLTTRFTINPSTTALVVARELQRWRCTLSQEVVESLRTMK